MNDLILFNYVVRWHQQELSSSIKTNDVNRKHLFLWKLKKQNIQETILMKSIPLNEFLLYDYFFYIQYLCISLLLNYCYAYDKIITVGDCNSGKTKEGKSNFMKSFWPTRQSNIHQIYRLYRKQYDHNIFFNGFISLWEM